MIRAARILLSLFLIAIALLCTFGFIATFEPLPSSTQWTWRTIYLLLGAGIGYGLHRLWRRPN